MVKQDCNWHMKDMGVSSFINCRFKFFNISSQLVPECIKFFEEFTCPFNFLRSNRMSGSSIVGLLQCAHQLMKNILENVHMLVVPINKVSSHIPSCENAAFHLTLPPAVQSGSSHTLAEFRNEGYHSKIISIWKTIDHVWKWQLKFSHPVSSGVTIFR